MMTDAAVVGGSGRTRTLASDSAAEARIERDMRRIASAVSTGLGPSLRALLLIGGYARGEGSVVDQGGMLGPYNDYDFVAVVDGRPSRFRVALGEIGRNWSERTGVEVDIWPIAEGDLETLPPTLFWLDVSLGGVELLAGERSTLDRLRRLRTSDVPLDECGRLLANRATGLALSNLEPADHDLRRARHGHKAVFAAGDVRLLAENRYAPTLAGRVAMLESLAMAPGFGEELVTAYHDAIRFRRRPDLWRPASGDLDAWYARVREQVGIWHLGYEAWRVGAPATPLGFGRSRVKLFPDLPDVRPLGAIAAAARAAVKGAAPVFPWLGHPRERLARASALLAYAPHDDRCRRQAAQLLGLRGKAAGDRDALHAALRRITAVGG